MIPYEAFYASAALIDLSARGRILATGEDRKRLLHALTTNQVEKISAGQGVYAFFLNAQGRILSDAILICREDALLLSVEPEARDKIYSHIDHYIIADDVTLSDITSSTVELALEGPESATILASLGALLPADPFSFNLWNGIDIVLASSTGAFGYRLIAPIGQLKSLTATLTAAGAVPASSTDQETVRIEHGMPRYGVDITESYIPQETRQMHALNFNKGCYLGQEIVERVRSRGHVNRLLTPIIIDAPSPAAPGTKIVAHDRDGNAKEVGEITSAALSPRQGGVRALAYVRAEALASAAPMTVGGAPAKPVQQL